MIITFIQPITHWEKKNKHFRLEPTIFAKLKALTPNDIVCKLYDERLEDIDYDASTDLVAITTTTFSAKRAYAIADKFLAKGIKVVIGGIHVDLCEDDAVPHATSIMVGEAEVTWPKLIEDLRKGDLQPKYKAQYHYDMKDYTIDYSIFEGKKYLQMHMIETTRGCKFNCSFCSLAPVYKQQITYRDKDNLMNQIKSLKDKYLFFIDDNFGNNKEYSIDFLKELIPLKKKWMAQISINYLQDAEFVKLLRKSGCISLIVGLESINKESLKEMNKTSNLIVDNYEKALQNCVDNDILINPGFITGTSCDSQESIKKTFEYANSFQFAIYGFINLFPYPGTALYNKLKNENRLLYEKWWLEDINFYRHPLFFTDNIKADEMYSVGLKYYREMDKLSNIFKRFIKSKYKLKTRCLILLINICMKYFRNILAM